MKQELNEFFNTLDEKELDELTRDFKADSLDRETLKNLCRRAKSRAGTGDSLEKSFGRRISRRAVIALAACIPMIMDTCGNCGQQASTLVVRGLATGELSPSDVFTVLWKETRVSLTVAAVLAFFCFLIQHFLFGAALNMSLVISAAMVCAVIFAKIIGGLLPLAAKAVKLDPALTAVPLITTISDTGSLLILFALASAILK